MSSFSKTLSVDLYISKTVSFVAVFTYHIKLSMSMVNDKFMDLYSALSQSL